MNLLSPEEVAACIVNTEPYALKDIDPEVLNHLIQYVAMLGAEKTNPKREWQGLTDEEKNALVDAFYGTDIQRLEAIETKLKELNT